MSMYRCTVDSFPVNTDVQSFFLDERGEFLVVMVGDVVAVLEGQMGQLAAASHQPSDAFNSQLVTGLQLHLKYSTIPKQFFFFLCRLAIFKSQAEFLTTFPGFFLSVKLFLTAVYTPCMIWKKGYFWTLKQQLINITDYPGVISNMLWCVTVT